MTESSPDYVWVTCRTPGWQVLMTSELKDFGVPEPPACVVSTPHHSLSKSPVSRGSRSQSRESPKANNTRPGRRSMSPPAPVIETSPNKTVSVAKPVIADPADWPSTLNQYAPPTRSLPSPKNFIIENRLLNKPSRQSKRDLLDEASRQLQASEVVGTSLAERLTQLHSQLSPS